MPIELGEIFNQGADWICGLSGVFALINNPIFVALLITGLALVIIYAIFRENLKGTGWRRGFKAGFWLVIGVSSLIFVHYYALKRCMQHVHSSQGIRNVMDSINYSVDVGGGHSVKPTITGGDYLSHLAAPIKADSASNDASQTNADSASNTADAIILEDINLEQIVLPKI